MKYKLLVFDWDGTLMDSQQEIISCFQSAAKAAHLDKPADEVIRNVIGLGMREAVQTIFPSLVSDESQQLFIEKYREVYFSPDKPDSILFEGVYDMLQQFLAADYLLAVATGKGRRGLDGVLKRTGLDKVFHFTRCVDEAHSKPHPQMLEDIIDYTGVEPCETLMIGDTEYDLQMAINAKVDGVGVYCGAHEPERLNALQPKACFNHTRELKPWLAQLD